MQDYKNTFLKWLAFFDSPKETRQAVLDSIHKETKAGFDIVTNIAMQELKGRIDDPNFFEKGKQLVGSLVAFSVFGGYMLYYIYNAIDPVQSRLMDRTELAGVGKIWVENQKNQDGRVLLKEIDPFMIMILNKGKEARMNQIMLNFPEVMNLSYRNVSHIEKFLNWGAVQGYILALIEQKLIRGEDIVSSLRPENNPVGGQNPPQQDPFSQPNNQGNFQNP